MWLLLCAADDRPALWAAARLMARGLAPLVVLTPELLHHSFGWQHRLADDHPARVAFTLADGRAIRGEAIRGVLNRIDALPPHLVDALPPPDRAYALQEWVALHVSWLSSLEVPVLNLPVGHGLCGPGRSHAEWTWLASQAGLPTAPLRRSTDPWARSGTDHPPGAATRRWGPEPALHAGRAADRHRADRPPPLRTVCVVDGVAVDDGLRPPLRAACGRLGPLAATRLLGVTLEKASGRFVSASPRPDLRSGGEAILDALVRALTNRG